MASVPASVAACLPRTMRTMPNTTSAAPAAGPSASLPASISSGVGGVCRDRAARQSSHMTGPPRKRGRRARSARRPAIVRLLRLHRHLDRHRVVDLVAAVGHAEIALVDRDRAVDFHRPPGYGYLGRDHDLLGLAADREVAGDVVALVRLVDF